MINEQDARNLAGRAMVDSTGDKIGDIGQVYFDDNTGQPSWATVKTGFFGTNESFVPLQNAEFSGDELRVPYTKAEVKDAPNHDVDAHLTRDEERALYAHYEMGDSYDRGTGYDRERHGNFDPDRDYRDDYRGEATGYDNGGTSDVGGGVAGAAGVTGQHADRDVSAGDAELVAHEERLRVGTETREAGRARLRKVVTTEEETVTVPVRREELRIEREPIADGTVREGSIDDIGDQEVEITLHEERPVVGKETVATERVRASTEVVTDDVEVSDTVRKENIEIADDAVDRDGDVDRRG